MPNKTLIRLFFCLFFPYSLVVPDRLRSQNTFIRKEATGIYPWGRMEMYSGDGCLIELARTLFLIKTNRPLKVERCFNIGGREEGRRGGVGRGEGRKGRVEEGEGGREGIWCQYYSHFAFN